MIGLGGAEFRLPLLLGLFGFAALQAVVVNKAMSLIVVLTALHARLVAVPYHAITGYWFVVVNLLAGSLLGAWAGATWATRMRSITLHRVLAILLVLIAGALAWDRFGPLDPLSLEPVAGSELLIPAIVLLFAVDIKIAGSLSLAISLPTMLVAFARYSRDRSFEALRANNRFVFAMASGSIIGTIGGGFLLGAVPLSRPDSLTSRPAARLSRHGLAPQVEGAFSRISRTQLQETPGGATGCSPPSTAARTEIAGSLGWRTTANRRRFVPSRVRSSTPSEPRCAADLPV
jgi:uncharacterized protein